MRIPAILMCAVWLSAGRATAQAPAGTDESGGAAGCSNVVLAADDIGGLRLVRTGSHPWVVAMDAAGRPQEMTGSVQEVTCRGVRVRIQYAVFESVPAARAAARFHLANVSASFQTGLWSRVHAAAIGDESWWTHSGSHALLIRSDNVCVLVGCRESDSETRDRVAEEIAARIVAKARAARGGAAPRPPAASP